MAATSGQKQGEVGQEQGEVGQEMSEVGHERGISCPGRAILEHLAACPE